MQPLVTFIEWRTTVKSQRTSRVVVMLLLLIAPGFALAQGGGSSHWQLHGPPSPERGSMREIHGMMSQMGGMMEHMVDRIQAGPLTPEHTKQMGEMMGQMAYMMQKMSGMTGAEAPQQMAPMMERMTEIHKRMMSMMAVPPAAPKKP